MSHPAYGRLWIFVKGPYSCKNLIEEIFNFSQVMYNLFDEASSFFFSFSYLFYYRVFIAAIKLVTSCVIDCGQRTFAENILSDKVLLDPRSSLRGR